MAWSMLLAKMLSSALFMTMALCAGETAAKASLVSVAAAGVAAGAAGSDAFGPAAASRVFKDWAAANSWGVGSFFFFLSFFTLGITMTSRSMEIWTGFLEIFTWSKDFVSSS